MGIILFTNNSQGQMNEHIYCITQNILSAYYVTDSVLNALFIVFAMVQLYTREFTLCILIPK